MRPISPSPTSVPTCARPRHGSGRTGGPSARILADGAGLAGRPHPGRRAAPARCTPPAARPGGRAAGPTVRPGPPPAVATGPPGPAHAPWRAAENAAAWANAASAPDPTAAATAAAPGATCRAARTHRLAPGTAGPAPGVAEPLRDDERHRLT